jgi:hypothetical protein
MAPNNQLASRRSDTPKDAQAAVLRLLVQSAVQRAPDNGRYVFCFLIPSESSNRLYKVSFDTAPGARWWTCSCRGNISHGNCKHLKAMGLMGREQARSLPSNDPRRMLPGRPTY